jgi:diguanylate cyclase (GGDEF)-like protein
MAMHGYYDFKLVALSLVIAIIASYTALELAGRVSQAKGRDSWFWLIGGAVSMGIGIWSMHFVGMLAFHLPIPVAYDAGITMLSMAIAILVSGLGLYVASRPALTGPNVTAGATLMGIGISAMHYTGMYAMRMSPPIEYNPPLFVASVVIAMAASLAALWMSFQLRHRRSRLAILARLGSAVIMGLAITGMHYTGMAAADFASGSVCLAVDSTGGMGNATLALIIGIATIGVLAITLALSALDAQFATRTAKLADSLQAANEQLRAIALHDSLTGLPNRVLLEDRLAQAVSRAERTQKPFSVMFVDLDWFKPVNDTYGHYVGDELLRSVAQRMTACVRKTDTVARAGGDEFVVVLGESGDAKNASIVGAKILEELARPFLVAGHDVEISCSIGISVYPADGRDVSTLMVKPTRRCTTRKRTAATATASSYRRCVRPRSARRGDEAAPVTSYTVTRLRR